MFFKKQTYIHRTSQHNLKAPEVIVPIICELFSPQSAIDFGCGLGTFLDVFKKQGVREVLGLDGPWANRELMAVHLEKSEFLESDLTKSVRLNKKFDVAISLEVAEHLPFTSAKTFVKSLTNSSDVVVFSAAIPFQGGQNHLNEMWPEEWEKLFDEFGYTRHDLIRPRIWNDSNVFAWYIQNIFVFLSKEVSKTFTLPNFDPNFRAVHPNIYHWKAKELYKIQNGTYSNTGYLRIFAKAILNRLRLRN